MTQHVPTEKVTANLKELIPEGADKKVAVYSHPESPSWGNNPTDFVLMPLQQYETIRTLANDIIKDANRTKAYNLALSAICKGT